MINVTFLDDFTVLIYEKKISNINSVIKVLELELKKKWDRADCDKPRVREMDHNCSRSHSRSPIKDNIVDPDMMLLTNVKKYLGSNDTYVSNL
nr:hypothetical protein [Tanacetum cinerariifolium]